MTEKITIQLVLMIVGGICTTLGTAFFTAHITSKQNEVHLIYIKEALQDLRNVDSKFDDRLRQVEKR